MSANRYIITKVRYHVRDHRNTGKRKVSQGRGNRTYIYEEREDLSGIIKFVLGWKIDIRD